jgi:sarcosine oxidase subunit alpha
VGFILPGELILPEEANLTLNSEDIAGRITSVAHSTTLDKTIGLCYVTPEQSEVGTTFDIKLSDGTRISAEVVERPFYDPENLRQAL